MSASIKQLAGARIGVVVWCHGKPTCVPHDEILAKFGDVTCEEASRKVRCTTCGAHGRDGKIEVLPSTLDMSDHNHGRPPGTTERQQAEQRTVYAVSLAEEKARYGGG